MILVSHPSPMRPRPPAHGIAHHQLGNLVGCQMRLVLRFLHDSRFPSLPDEVAARDQTPFAQASACSLSFQGIPRGNARAPHAAHPVEWRTPYYGDTRATV